MALVPGQQKYLEDLKAMRRRLASELRAIINEFGPQVYDDFDQVFAIFFCLTETKILTSISVESHLGAVFECCS